MSNPWLEIPEADYVAHMSSPAVGQRPVLSRLLGEALERVRRDPSVAVYVEPGGDADAVHQPAEAGVAVSIRGTHRAR